MEFEKFVFRMHKFLLGQNCCKGFLEVTLVSSIFLIFIQLPFFLYGNHAFINTDLCLGQKLSEKYILDPDELPENVNLTNAIRPQHILNISITELSLGFVYANFEFSGKDYLVSLSKTAKIEHNFTIHQIDIDAQCYASSVLGRYLLATVYGFDNILVNDIVRTMKNFDVYLRDNQSRHNIAFSLDTVKDINEWDSTTFHLISVFFNLLKISIGIFLIYTATALYIRMLLMCIPILFFLGTRRGEALTQITWLCSWMGIYNNTLISNNKKNLWVFGSFYLCYTLFEKLLETVQSHWYFLLFDKMYIGSVHIYFHQLVYWTEFFSVLFIRTRTSLKHVPRISILLMVMFIYYFQHTVYGFNGLAFWILMSSVSATFAYFLLTFEIPALQWNPSTHYTPSYRSPRMLYFPIFSLTWVHDLPPIWTMFYPLFGRSHFSNVELSFVDGNHALLRQRLEAARDGVPFDQEFMGDGGGANDHVNLDVADISQDNNNSREQILIQNDM